MKLRPKFENARATLINRGNLTMESVLGELARDETRLNTQAQLDTKSNSVDAVFITSRSKFQSKQKHGGREGIRCRYCNELGHVLSHCRKRNICNYCKKSGHIILDYRILKNKQSISLCYHGL